MVEDEQGLGRGRQEEQTDATQRLAPGEYYPRVGESQELRAIIPIFGPELMDVLLKNTPPTRSIHLELHKLGDSPQMLIADITQPTANELLVVKLSGDWDSQEVLTGNP